MNNTRDSYDALDLLNWSRLRLLEKSPAHFKQGFGDDSSGFALGTAAHMAVLEPERFLTHYVVFTGKVRRGKVWDAFEQQALDAGKEVLSQREYDSTLAIKHAVHANARAMHYLQGGASEQTLTWELSGGGLKFGCKGRADYIGPHAIVDLKSTKDCSPRAFARACANYGYFGQAAWYSDGLFLSRGERKPYMIIAVESAPPHIVTVYRLPDAVIAHGRDQYQTLLGKLDYCRKTNFWGGYSESEELDIEIPRWSGAQSEES